MKDKSSAKLLEELNLVKENILNQVISNLDSNLDIRTNNISNSYEELVELSFFFNNKRFFLDGITKEDGEWVVWFAETTKEYFDLVGTSKQDGERLDVLLSELETFGTQIQDLNSEELVTLLSTIEKIKLSLK
jgi:hypothetical protein